MKRILLTKQPKKIAAFTGGRDNNFNLIRICASFAVLVSHGFALASGSRAAEPLQQSLGTTPGKIAVDIFFIASGFLVAGSLLTRKSIVEFFWARFLRIYPALFIMTLLSIFCLGPFFTSLSFPAYFFNQRTAIFFCKNATIMTGVAYYLPGVFEANPYKFAVNGSLWTLPYEIKMYAFLAILWGVLRGVFKCQLKTYKIAIVLLAVTSGAIHIIQYYWFHANTHFARLFFMFFTGAAFYVLKERIVLSDLIFMVFFAAISCAAFYKPVFFFVYSVTIAYLLFYLAYVPEGFIRKYNQVGDYSYGGYIYAFPVQQSVVALAPNISASELILISAPITLALAVGSWHLLELHALSLKKYCAERTQAFLRRSR